LSFKKIKGRRLPYTSKRQGRAPSNKQRKPQYGETGGKNVAIKKKVKSHEEQLKRTLRGNVL